MRLSTLLLLITLGCTPKPEHKADSLMFDLPKLVDELVLGMDTKNHRAIKTFELNYDSETKQYESTDSSFWAIQLARLREIDLNSPQIRDVLNITTNIKDDKSNLLINEYLVSENNNASLKKLSVYYLNDTSEIRQIYAELNSDNLIANSTTKINLWINRYNDGLLIDSLQIVGCEKTFMQAEREYQITTRIIW
jgi:hypothetical protein